jgi:phage tail-like protein
MAVTTPGAVQDAELIGSWFGVTLDNGVSGFFSDASGLSIEIEVVTITQSEKDTATRMRPGTTKYGEITLKRTLTEDKKFWNWAKEIRDGGKDYRTNGSISMYDMGGESIGMWKFEHAWPSKWSASDLDVGTDDPMQETVVLQVELLTREK